MKKKLLALLLLVPILLIPIISCEGDALGGLSELMGSFGKNSLIEGKIVVPDTSQGAKATKAMSGLAGLDKDDDDYEEVYAAGVQEIKDTVNEALASKGSAKAKAFVEDMKTLLAEDAKKPKKVEDAIEEYAKDPGEGGLGIEIVVETEGDLLAAVLLVDLMDKAKDDWTDVDEEEIVEFISEALQVIDVVKTVSPANGIKIDDILGELLDGDLSELFRGRKGVSRDGDDDLDEALATIKPILDSIIKEIGKGEDGKISEKGLKRMVSSFGMMRVSYESLAPLLAGRNQQLELTDIVNYTLSVVFTEVDKIIKDKAIGDKTFKDLIDAYILYDEDDDLSVFADFDDLFDSEDEGLIMATLKEAMETLFLLLDATTGGQQIKDMLEDITNDDNDD